jgi:predicted amidophosphoribosyltransferase
VDHVFEDPQLYLHYFGNETVNSLLESRGIITKEDNDKNSNNLKSRICINCSEPNKPDGKFCISCKMILSFDSYKQTLEIQDAKKEQIKSLTLRLDKYEEAYNEGRILSKEYKKSIDIQDNRLLKLEEHLESVIAQIKAREEERKENRDFENENDPVKRKNLINI